MDEKRTATGQELSDEELSGVSGGKNYWEWQGKYYKYDGEGMMFYCKDWDECYLCPNCGRPVHWGDWSRWYCDACDESWYYESKLVPNIAGGPWKEISHDDYIDATEW